MAKKVIIGVSGKKQSGKNTMCDCLYELFTEKYSSDDVLIFSFADALKQKVCKDVLGLTDEQVNGTDEEKNSVTIIDRKQLNHIKSESDIWKLFQKKERIIHYKKTIKKFGAIITHKIFTKKRKAD